VPGIPANDPERADWTARFLKLYGECAGKHWSTVQVYEKAAARPN
jgi:hypothetical protein